MFYRDEPLALYIDYPDFLARFADTGYKIDWKLLRSEFVKRGICKGCWVYDPEKQLDPHEMALEGFVVVNENVDIKLTLQITHMAREKQMGHAVLFTSDARFVPVVQEVRRLGPRVSVVSTGDGIAPELMLADITLIPLDEVKEVIGKKG